MKQCTSLAESTNISVDLSISICTSLGECGLLRVLLSAFPNSLRCYFGVIFVSGCKASKSLMSLNALSAASINHVYVRIEIKVENYQL